MITPEVNGWGRAILVLADDNVVFLYFVVLRGIGKTLKQKCKWDGGEGYTCGTLARALTDRFSMDLVKKEGKKKRSFGQRLIRARLATSPKR